MTAKQQSPTLDTKKGKRGENDLVNELNTETGREYRAVPSGYSGNHVGPAEDIVLLTPAATISIELKNTGQDKYTVDSEDLSQLAKCVNSHTRAFLGIDRNYRELLFVELTNTVTPADGLAEEIPACWNPRATRTGNLIIEDPTALGWADQWPSKQKGRSNSRVILDSLRESSSPP